MGHAAVEMESSWSAVVRRVNCPNGPVNPRGDKGRVVASFCVKLTVFQRSLLLPSPKAPGVHGWS